MEKEEQLLWQRYWSGDKGDDVIESLLSFYSGRIPGLVKSTVKKIPHWMDLSDLISIATVALWGRIHRYTPEIAERYTFINFAKTRICGAVVDYMRTNGYISRAGYGIRCVNESQVCNSSEDGSRWYESLAAAMDDHSEFDTSHDMDIYVQYLTDIESKWIFLLHYAEDIPRGALCLLTGRCDVTMSTRLKNIHHEIGMRMRARA